MLRAFQDARVESYQEIATTISDLPDEYDSHVIAAAIKCRADLIVTENIKDFPRSVLEQYGIEAKTSDEFIADSI